jgi:hypothetical protein
MHPICAAVRGRGPTGRGPGTARVMPNGGKKTFTCVVLEIYEIPYMKKVTEFREIPRNSAEFHRNCSQFRTEYGIDGGKKTDGIPCRRNSMDTLTVYLYYRNGDARTTNCKKQK